MAAFGHVIGFSFGFEAFFFNADRDKTGGVDGVELGRDIKPGQEEVFVGALTEYSERLGIYWN